MIIQKADKKDLKEILELQHLAYLSEAKLVNDYNIQPLTQTLEELIEEYDGGVVLKAVNSNGKVVGSVRGGVKDNTLHIGKLMTHPDYQNKGIGTKLIYEIERLYPNTRKELFTSCKSSENIKLYKKLGYIIFKEKVTPKLKFIYLEKK